MPLLGSRAGLLLLRNPGPRVSQRNRPVEDERARLRIGVNAEIAQTLELKSAADGGVAKARFSAAAAKNLQRSGVQIREKHLTVRHSLGILHRKEAIVQPHFDRHGKSGGDPM